MTETNLLREIADNWMLVAMFTFFLGAVLWAFRPGSRAVHRETSSIPFRNDDMPPSQTKELQK